jgi:hypothetical protein
MNRNFPDAYELSADDFTVIRSALRFEADRRRELFKVFNLRWPFTQETKASAELLQATEDLIERFDNADNVWMEINV